MILEDEDLERMELNIVEARKMRNLQKTLRTGGFFFQFVIMGPSVCGWQALHKLIRCLHRRLVVAPSLSRAAAGTGKKVQCRRHA